MFSSSRRDRVTSAPVAYSQSSGRLLAMHRPQAGLLPSHFYKELVYQGCFPSDDDQSIHTALSLRHGKQAAPLFRGRLAEEDEDDENRKKQRAEAFAAARKRRKTFGQYDGPASTLSVLVVTCWTLRLPVMYVDFIRSVGTLL